MIPSTIPTLSDAITAVETSTADYQKAVNQTVGDQSTVDAIQAKLDTAKTTVKDDQASQDAKKQALLAAYDVLIAAITAAKNELAGAPPSLNPPVPAAG